MRPASVVMRHPVCRDVSQVGLGYRDQVVEAFSAECADDAFAEAVGFWASRWGFQDMNPHMRNRLVKPG